MRNRWILVAALAAPGLVPTARGEMIPPRPDTLLRTSPDFAFGLKGTLWLAAVDGEIQGDAGRVEGDSLDFNQDLDTDNDTVIPIVDAHVDLWETWRVQASYWGTSFDGGSTADTAATFEGTTYAVGADLDSEVTLHRADVLVARTFISPRRGTHPERFEAGLGAKVFSFDTDITSVAAGSSDSIGDTVVLPVLSVRAEFLFYEDPDWSFGCEVGGNGMGIAYAKDRAAAGEAFVELYASWSRKVYAGFGWRYFTWASSHEDEGSGDGEDSFELEMQGITLSLMVWF